MSIRFKLWLGAMVCATLLMTALAIITAALASWSAPASGAPAAPPGLAMLLAGALVLALFAPIAWLLARLAYAPVREVTRTARRIVMHHQLDSRCFYPGPLDDVGRLVVVVNELLVRYDASLARILRLRAAPPACACPREDTPPDAADLVLELEPHGGERPVQPGN